MMHRSAKTVAVRATMVLSREYSNTPANSSMLKQVSAWLSRMGRKTTVGQATALFNSCQVQAAHPLWQRNGLIGSDFRSKHMLLVLHVWMVHKRLLTEGKPGLLVQEALFDELWEDTANRIRGQGVMEISVNKYLKEVQSYSFRCCVELDHVLDKALKAAAAEQGLAQTKLVTNGAPRLSEDDEEQLLDDMGGVLWRLVYLRREDLDLDTVLQLAQYVRREQASLLGLDRAAVFEGRIRWGPLPQWKKHGKAAGSESSDASAAQEEDAERERELKKKGEWREATAPDGRTYYWNTATRESRWEKPTDA